MQSQHTVLIDQTMLCEASRLIEGVPAGAEFYEYLGRFEKQPQLSFRQMPRTLYPHYAFGMENWPPSNAERLFHLATLLDAITLYDDVRVLKAELPPDANSLPLREFLLECGIVQHIDASSTARTISDEFREFLACVEPNREQVYLTREKLAEEIANVVAHSLQNTPVPRSPSETDDIFQEYPVSETVADGLIKQYEGTVSHWWLEEQSQQLTANAIATLGGYMLDKIGYFGSGAVVEGISHLRTFVYWRLSDHLGIPFFPSCRRLPHFEAMARQLTPTVHQEVFQVLARAFKATVEQVYEDCQPTALPVPPLTSLFLDKLRTQKDASACIMEIREEFRGLREALRNLQSELRGSASIRQRLDAKRQLAKVIEDLKQHYEMRNDTFIDEALAFAPDVLKPLSNPMNPEKYSINLIKKPLEWIRTWWANRPFRCRW